jgi:ankyrin repeat protein
MNCTKGILVIFLCLIFQLGIFAPQKASGADINQQLLEAAEKGDKAAVESLLARGAKPNARNKEDGWTALMYAAQEGHADVVEALLAAKADVNAKAKNGSTALTIAAQRGYTEAVKILLAASPDVNASNNAGVTSLMFAADRGHRETVEELLAAGADPNAKAQNGWTAAMYAKSGGHSDVVELLNKGAAAAQTPPSIQPQPQQTAAGEGMSQQLMEAAEKGDKTAVEALLTAGADPSAIARNGWTALQMAAYHGDIDLVRPLLAKGADVSARDVHGRTALIIAADIAFSTKEKSLPGQQAVAVVGALVAAGADVNAKQQDGQTGLMLAADNGDTEMVRALLAAGADPNVMARVPHAKCHVASNGHVVCDFNSNEKPRDWTPLKAAQEKGLTEIVEQLKRAGAKR